MDILNSFIFLLCEKIFWYIVHSDKKWIDVKKRQFRLHTRQSKMKWKWKYFIFLPLVFVYQKFVNLHVIFLWTYKLQQTKKVRRVNFYGGVVCGLGGRSHNHDPYFIALLKWIIMRSMKSHNCMCSVKSLKFSIVWQKFLDVSIRQLIFNFSLCSYRS